MRGYDSWLEAPYVDAERRSDRYEQWCDERDLDAGEDHWAAFEQWEEDAHGDRMAEQFEAMQREG